MDGRNNIPGCVFFLVKRDTRVLAFIFLIFASILSKRRIYIIKNFSIEPYKQFRQFKK